MVDQPRAAGIDALGFVAAASGATIAVGALSPIGFAAAFVPPALFWLTRRRSWMVGCLIAGGAIGAYSAVSGAAERAWGTIQSAAIGGWNSGLPIAQTYSQWLAFASDRSIWAPAAAIGFIIGAAGVLIYDARSRSQFVALSEGRADCPHRRAPAAALFHALLNRRPAKRRQSVVIGSEWETGRPISLPIRHLNRHGLVGGTTGVGKSTVTCGIIEALGGPAVVVDGKGDIRSALATREYAKQHKIPFFLFAPTLSLNSVIYNPFSSGDYTSIADRLMTLREWTEPHYVVVADLVLQTELKTLQLCGVPLDISSIASHLDPNILAKIAKETRKHAKLKAPFDEILHDIGTLFEFEKDIGGLKAELLSMRCSVVGRLFDPATAAQTKQAVLSLKQAREEGAIVYFCLPGLQYARHAAYIGKIVINDLKYVAGTSNAPWTLVMDEFSVFTGDNILYLLNQGREFGLRVILAVQALNDISRGVAQGGELFRDQVLASINTYIVHRMNAPSDREYFASISGTKKIIGHTSQTVGGKGTGAASARFDRAFVLHPDDIRDQRDYEAYVINCNSGTTSRVKTRLSVITKERDNV